MADRASASIRIGGNIPRSAIPCLLTAIATDGGRADWEGEPIDETSVRIGEVLEVYAWELPGGIFQEVEAFCEAQRLPFVRVSGSCSGAFGPERVVFTGDGPTCQFDLTECDEVVLTRYGFAALGSVEAVEHWFASAEFSPPPVTIVDDVESQPRPEEMVHG